MISCQYCGSTYEAFQPTCAACGAPLPVHQIKVTESPKTHIIEEIRRYCCQHLRMHFIKEFQVGTSISEKKLKTIKKSFRNFPQGKEIFFYCDTSPLNNGKQGFLICEDGIYWQNSWLKHTNRNFLPWNKFKEREIVLEKYDLCLGAGDVISLAGLGKKVLFSIIEKIFKRIQTILSEGHGQGSFLF
jgi:hypothetical protein